MRIKSRVIKLEAAVPKVIEPLHILKFIVDPKDIDPIGYCCEGTTIMRLSGESTEELRKRCSDSVSWPTDYSAIKVFESVQKKRRH
ncbi:MAG: hypothetical protein ABL919_10455 [Methylococcales bacterium]|nr:hypothetical protein [Methylococcaceae bacterium]